jgi:hypothetical protein
MVDLGFTVGEWEVTEKVHGCLTGNTSVETLECGRVPLSDIVDNKRSVHVKSFDTETGEIVYNEVTNWSKQKSINNWYEVETEDGTVITVTGNHLVWLPKLKCYRSVEELVEGDEFLIDY